MKALGVSIDGREIGFFASLEQGPFFAMVGNIPRKYMRAFIMTETATESWQWQLPNVQQNERIAFRIAEAQRGDIRPPGFVRPREIEEIANVDHRHDMDIKTLAPSETNAQTQESTAAPVSTKAETSTKALQVSIDGIVVGVFVPPSGFPFGVSLRDGPQESIITSVSYPGGSLEADWNLPLVRQGQCISFRMIDCTEAESAESQIIIGR